MSDGMQKALDEARAWVEELDRQSARAAHDVAELERYFQRTPIRQRISVAIDATSELAWTQVEQGAKRPWRIAYVKSGKTIALAAAKRSVRQAARRSMPDLIRGFGVAARAWNAWFENPTGPAPGAQQ